MNGVGGVQSHIPLNQVKRILETLGQYFVNACDSLTQPLKVKPYSSLSLGQLVHEQQIYISFD